MKPDETIRDNGVTLYVKNGYWVQKTLYDIDIEPGIDTVIFSHVTDVNLRGVMKQFPDVKTIKIQKPVSKIEISNFMFPNTEHVISETGNFETGPYLIQFRRLLNTFYQKARTTLDLKEVDYIEPYALEGCMAELLLNKKVLPKQNSMKGCRISIGCEDTDGRIELGGYISEVVRDEVLIPESTKDINSNIRIHNGMTLRIQGEKMLKLFDSRLGTKEGYRLGLNLSGSAEDIPLIRRYSFSGLFNSEVIVSENPFCKSINGILYSKDGKILICCPKGKSGEIRVPEGVERIANQAFRGCEKITSISLPGSLREIGNCSFWGCNELKNINMKEGIVEIGKIAFSSCNSLKEIRIPGSVKKIGNEAFRFCPNLESVILNEGLEEIGEEVFEEDTKLTEISIPQTVRKIGRYAFPNLFSLTLSGDRIPSGLIGAVCRELNTKQPTKNELFRFIEGHIFSGRKFYIPFYISNEAVERSDDRLSIFGDTEGYLDFLFKNAIFNEAKQECAVRAYMETGREELRVYLRRIAKNVVDTYLKYKKEDELIEFLKQKLVSESTLKYVIEKTDNMPEVKAYALSVGKDSKSFRL